MIRYQYYSGPSTLLNNNEPVSSKEPRKNVVFEQALQNVISQVEVQPRRVGGATYRVPAPAESTKPGIIDESLTFRANSEYWHHCPYSDAGKTTTTERICTTLGL